MINHIGSKDKLDAESSSQSVKMGLIRFTYYIFRRRQFTSFGLSDFWKLVGLVIISWFIVSKFTFEDFSNLSSTSNHPNFEERKPNGIKERLQTSETIWRKSVEQRKNHVKSQGGLSKINPWNISEVVFYWDYFYPSFNCPHFVQRVGRIGDGGKWICGLEVYEKSQENCIIYSFGVANESSFEAEFLQRTNCEIYAYDFSVQGMGSPLNEKDLNPRVHFEPFALSNRNINETFLTLGEIMRRNGHDWIDFLKIDIEGQEFACLEQVMDEFNTFLPFGQLQLEIHVDHYGRGFKSVYNWWERLEISGLRSFNSEVNHNPCVSSKVNPITVEYSFINVKGNHPIIR